MSRILNTLPAKRNTSIMKRSKKRQEIRWPLKNFNHSLHTYDKKEHKPKMLLKIIFHEIKLKERKPNYKLRMNGEKLKENE